MAVVNLAGQTINGEQLVNLYNALPVSEKVEDNKLEWNEQDLHVLVVAKQAFQDTVDKEDEYEVGDFEVHRVKDAFNIGIQVIQDVNSTQRYALIVFDEEPTLEDNNQEMVFFWFESKDYYNEWLEQNGIVKK